MKIIVEKVVNGEKVLVPEVFLASVRAENLTNDGALIVGGDVAIYSKENIENIGTIRADGTVELKGENINNLGGRIDGENVNLDADKNITNKGGNIRARVDTILNGENVINEANVKESQYKGLDQKTVGNAGSIRTGQNLSINVEKDIVNKGSVLVADNNLDLNAGRKGFGLYCAFEKGASHTCEKVYLGNPKKAAAYLMLELRYMEKEVFMVLALNTKNRIMPSEVVSVGTLICSLFALKNQRIFT